MSATQGEESTAADQAKGRLSELYRRHHLDVVRLAYLITGDRTLAEDLVQEAFVRVSGRFLDLRDPEAFEAYLRRTVVNLARKHFRRRKVERAYLDRVGPMPVGGSGEPDIALREMLRDALLELPIRQRSAIVLRFYADLSEARTAEILRCRPGTVKSLVSRGMETLRAAVEDQRGPA